MVFSNDLWVRRVENSRLAKAAVAKPSGQMRNEKLHATVVRSAFFVAGGHMETQKQEPCRKDSLLEAEG